MSASLVSRRRFLTATAGMAGVAGLAACSGPGGSSSTSKTVTWSTWGDPAELKRYQQFNKYLKGQHPTLDIVFQPVPSYSDYSPKLLTELTSHTAPDVFYVGDDTIGQFVNADVLLPLNHLLTSPASRSKPNAVPTDLYGAARKADGTILAVPNDCNPDVFWYDKIALSKAGITEDPAELAADGKWTVATLLDMCEKLASKKMIGAMFYNYWSTHWSWVSAYGGKVYDTSGRFVLPADHQSREALASLGKAFQDKQFTVADLLPNADSPFVAHKAGFLVEGRYGISDAIQSGSKSSYDIAPWPSLTGHAMPSGVALSYLAINKSTKNVDQAFTFFTNFVSAKGQMFRLRGAGNAVPTISGADSVVLDGFPKHAKTFLDLRDNGFVDYLTEEKSPGLSTDISNAMLSYYQGHKSLDQAISAIAKLVSKAK